MHLCCFPFWNTFSVFLILMWTLCCLSHCNQPAQCKKPGTKIQLRIDQRKHWEKNWMHKLCFRIYHLFCPDSYLQREQKVSCHKLTFFVKTVQLRFFISEPCVFSYWFKSLKGFFKTSVKRVNFGIFQIFQTRSFTKQKADRGGYSLSF